MIKNQRGNALLLVIIVFATLFAFVGISLNRGIAVVGKIQRQARAEMALNLAEAGVEYALYKIHDSKEFFGEENIELETGTFSTSVSYLTPSGKIEIFSTGIVPGNRNLEEVRKSLKVVVQIDSENPPVVYSRGEV